MSASLGHIRGGLPGRGPALSFSPEHPVLPHTTDISYPLLFLTRLPNGFPACANPVPFRLVYRFRTRQPVLKIGEVPADRLRPGTAVHELLRRLLWPWSYFESLPRRDDTLRIGRLWTDGVAPGDVQHDLQLRGTVRRFSLVTQVTFPVLGVPGPGMDHGLALFFLFFLYLYFFWFPTPVLMTVGVTGI